MADELFETAGRSMDIRPLLANLRGLIQDARKQILRSADVIQVQTCWEIGRHIVEFEQGGSDRAQYGKQLLPALAATLTAEFGKGFDVTNLRHMRGFYLAFPIRDALRRELSWTHYRTLLRAEDAKARQWYMNESADQGWSTRALERQIGTLYYERLLASSDRREVEQEAAIKIAPLQQNPREFVRDPVMLEFLGLPVRENCWNRISNKLSWTICKRSFLNWARALLLSRASCASAPSRRISISTWCSTTICSSASFCST
jgi:hypothetical protein